MERKKKSSKALAGEMHTSAIPVAGVRDGDLATFFYECPDGNDMSLSLTVDPPLWTPFIRELQ